MSWSREQDSFRIERLDGYMGHGSRMSDTVFASHFGEGFLYGSDMLTHPGETPAPTVEGGKVLQVSKSRLVFVLNEVLCF